MPMSFRRIGIYTITLSIQRSGDKITLDIPVNWMTLK